MKENNDQKKLGFFPYAAVLLVAGLAVLLVVLVTAPKKAEPGTDGSSAVSTEETKSPISVLDTMAVNALVETYFEAKMNADADTLNRIVVSDNTYNAADLASDTNVIQKYDHFRTYIIESETAEDHLIVYVTYDMYFLGIDVGAPSLNHFTFKRSGDGFVIYDRFVSHAFEEELKATEETTVVQNLKKQVEEDLEAACEENQDLKELMQFLEGNAGTPESTEAPTEKETEKPEKTAEPSEEATEPVDATDETTEDNPIEPPETEDRHN